jgi:large subunit ribosomal protein L36
VNQTQRQTKDIGHAREHVGHAENTQQVLDRQYGEAKPLPKQYQKETPMKVRSSIKRRTRDCQIVVRKGKRLVINKKNPRLKQRQG